MDFTATFLSEKKKKKCQLTYPKFLDWVGREQTNSDRIQDIKNQSFLLIPVYIYCSYSNKFMIQYVGFSILSI